MQSKTHNIDEKTNSIPIKKSSPINAKSESHEYGLKQNFFDPSKSSPPNNFMVNLHNRMMNHNSASQRPLPRSQRPTL